MHGESNRSVGGSSERSAESSGLTMTESVVNKIVALAVRTVPGVHPPGLLRDGAVRTEFEDDRVIVHLGLVLEHGVRIPDVVQDVRVQVGRSVRRMTDLEVGTVHVLVTDVHVREEET